MMRIISKNPLVQAHYEACIQQGTSDTLAEMFAMGQPPMSDTDREFLEGWVNGNQFENQPAIGDMFKREAIAAGVSTTGRRYMESLARWPGDPRAWISDKSDVRRICEEDGRTCRGAVNYNPPSPISPPEEVSLADDIIQEKVFEILSGLPEADRPHVDTLDLAEQVKEAMSPHWSK